MKVILGGGGSAMDEHPLNEIYAQWIGTHGRLLYWPIALRGIRPFESCFEWITSTFAPFGITDIAMWTTLAGHDAHELGTFDGVYIGGGNTFSLLAELQQSRFDTYLKGFATQGKPIYGGSAGAAVLGRDIRTVDHIDHNQAGITDTTGLDFAQGYAVWPHYVAEDDDLIYAYTRRYKQPVLAISERSGIVIEGEELRAAGFEPALRFDEHGKNHV